MGSGEVAVEGSAVREERDFEDNRISYVTVHVKL